MKRIPCNNMKTCTFISRICLLLKRRGVRWRYILPWSHAEGVAQIRNAANIFKYWVLHYNHIFIPFDLGCTGYGFECHNWRWIVFLLNAHDFIIIDKWMNTYYNQQHRVCLIAHMQFIAFQSDFALCHWGKRLFCVKRLVLKHCHNQWIACKPY